jgi:hypothetical protein
VQIIGRCTVAFFIKHLTDIRQVCSMVYRQTYRRCASRYARARRRGNIRSDDLEVVMPRSPEAAVVRSTFCRRVLMAISYGRFLSTVSRIFQT